MTSRARSGLVLGAVLAIAAILAAPGSAWAAATPAAPNGTLVQAPDDQQGLPPVSSRDALRIATRTPQVRSEHGRHPDLRPTTITLYRGSGNWGITYTSKGK